MDNWKGGQSLQNKCAYVPVCGQRTSDNYIYVLYYLITKSKAKNILKYMHL